MELGSAIFNDSEKRSYSVLDFTKKYKINDSKFSELEEKFKIDILTIKQRIKTAIEKLKPLDKLEIIPDALNEEIQYLISIGELTNVCLQISSFKVEAFSFDVLIALGFLST